MKKIFKETKKKYMKKIMIDANNNYRNYQNKHKFFNFKMMLMLIISDIVNLIFIKLTAIIIKYFLLKMIDIVI